MAAAPRKTIEERVAEQLAAAPPITDEQRSAAVRILASVTLPRVDTGRVSRVSRGAA